MDVTARMIEEIPRGNLRVPRSEFAAVWAEAERLCDEARHGGPGSGWYAVGVAETRAGSPAHPSSSSIRTGHSLSRRMLPSPGAVLELTKN